MQATEFPFHWMNLVNAGDVDGVVSLYDDGAVLLPTFSGHQASDHESIGDYFQKLGSRVGLKVEIDRDSLGCIEMGDGRSVLSGCYSFIWDEDGSLAGHPSRFTFVIDLRKAAPILHHHSSQVPGLLA